MGLSAYLEGTMNGMFLVMPGLIWNKIDLSNKCVYCGLKRTVKEHKKNCLKRTNFYSG